MRFPASPACTTSCSPNRHPADAMTGRPHHETITYGTPLSGSWVGVLPPRTVGPRVGIHPSPVDSVGPGGGGWMTGRSLTGSSGTSGRAPLSGTCRRGSDTGPCRTICRGPSAAPPLLPWSPTSREGECSHSTVSVPPPDELLQTRPSHERPRGLSEGGAMWRGGRVRTYSVGARRYSGVPHHERAREQRRSSLFWIPNPDE
jgi:hypothetical protein